LRLIAGFYAPDEGQIRFNGESVNDVPASERGIGMVFQNFALWPHMTVHDNAAYGLKLRKLGQAEIAARVGAVFEKVRLTGLGDRYPGQLSGGQQQRVALARALVLSPQILLLDEPLSNLDAKIRVQVRQEIRKLQRELGITTMYVTHDQEEALTLSDRIAVFNQGKVFQVGPPKELYERPGNRFVADFIGINNLIDGTVVAADSSERRLRSIRRWGSCRPCSMSDCRRATAASCASGRRTPPLAASRRRGATASMAASPSRPIWETRCATTSSWALASSSRPTCATPGTTRCCRAALP
jgi:iron(III) transport system ATP-binding protein